MCMVEFRLVQRFQSTTRFVLHVQEGEAQHRFLSTSIMDSVPKVYSSRLALVLQLGFDFCRTHYCIGFPLL